MGAASFHTLVCRRQPALAIGTTACPGLRSGIDSRHSFRHSSESWNPEGVGMGKTTRRWKKPARHPIFILLCGPLSSMVIPASAGIQGEEWVPPVFIPWCAGGNRHGRLVRKHVPLSDQGWPAPATPARISCSGEMPNRPERNRQRKDPNRPLLLGEGWGEGETASARARGTNDPRTLPPTSTPTLHTLVCRRQSERAITMRIDAPNGGAGRKM